MTQRSSPIAQRRAEALARLAARRMELPPREVVERSDRELRLVQDPRPGSNSATGPAHDPGAHLGQLPHHPPTALGHPHPVAPAGHDITRVDGRPSTHARPGLSQREQQVLRTWLLTDSKAEVAEQLSISMGTVNTHLARIRNKYTTVGRRAGTKAALAARAIQDGLISLDEL